MKETSPFRAAKIYLHLGTNNINGINLVQDFGFPALLLSSSIFSIAFASNIDIIVHRRGTRNHTKHARFSTERQTAIMLPLERR